MKFAGWRLKFVLVLVLVVLTGCSLPTTPPPLTAAAAQQTLNTWNPTFCKVVKFYGFYQPGHSPGPTQVAYVSLVNPGDQLQKQTIFAARFELLTHPDGRRQWYLTSLISHAAGLSRRQGWDNLMEPVKEGVDTGSR
ncbi:MAG: hypothetical protein PHU44_18575 [Syntrophales bacterium]|nr:hypothetical protein [Syntrophales bacterium]MDD5640284.1 hypothetical protein [Syntrophales bacterium]